MGIRDQPEFMNKETTGKHRKGLKSREKDREKVLTWKERKKRASCVLKPLSIPGAACWHSCGWTYMIPELGCYSRSTI